jgi:hypothetical protein
MKITIIADDNDVTNTLKSLKFPFIKKHSLFRLLMNAITAYENKQEGQKIRVKSGNPKVVLIIEDE